MKNKVISSIMCVFVLIALSACGNEENIASVSESSVTVSTPITFESTEVTVSEETEPFYTVETMPSIEVFISDESLIGTWRYEDEEEQLVYRYIFNEDGTGYFTVASDSQAVAFNTTYTVNEDGTLGILPENVLRIENYSFSVQDNVLTLTDVNGVSTEYQAEVDSAET